MSIFLKTNFLRFGNHDLPLEMENLNDFTDIMFKDLNYKIESDDSIERYIVPLDAIIETKSL